MIVESKIVPIDSIHPNEWNCNELKPSVYSFLKKNIKKRGFLQPVIINKEGVIIDGEHRHRALKELGEKEIEVKVLDLTDEECKAETVNLNLTKGTFDIEGLGAILLELDEKWGKDLLKENLVMEQKQIDAAIRAFQKEEPLNGSDVLPLAEPVVTETKICDGDIFKLGRHFIRCGDSTDLDGVRELIGDNKIDLVLTDPPYNVGYEYKTHDDNMSEEDYNGFINQFINVGKAVCDFIIVTPGNRNEKYYYRSFEDIIGVAFWYKGFALTVGPISRCMVTEPILFIGRKPKNKALDTDHLEYHTDREVGLLEQHSCPKPVGLFKELLLAFTDNNGTVLDLFGGSGTTLIAAESCGRVAFIHESDPNYVESIIRRFESMTGQKRVKIEA